MHYEIMLINLEKYHRPKSLAEALNLLKDSDGSIVPIAGGTHLVASNDKRIREVVDIMHLGFHSFLADEEGVWIGATTTLQKITNSRKLRKPPYNILPESCQTTSASKMIRNVATLGGEIAHRSKYSDITTTLLALDAQALLAPCSAPFTKDQGVLVPLWEPLTENSDFSLKRHLIKDIRINLPGPMERVGSAFIRLSQIPSSPTIISAAARLSVKDGLCHTARIALGAAGPQPRRVTEIESMLEGRTLDEALIDEVSEKVPEYIEPFSDARASAEYRKRVSGVLVKRALKASLEKINHQP